jgi:hypothetical protein
MQHGLVIDPPAQVRGMGRVVGARDDDRPGAGDVGGGGHGGVSSFFEFASIQWRTRGTGSASSCIPNNGSSSTRRVYRTLLVAIGRRNWTAKFAVSEISDILTLTVAAGSCSTGQGASKSSATAFPAGRPMDSPSIVSTPQRGLRAGPSDGSTAASRPNARRTRASSGRPRPR